MVMEKYNKYKLKKLIYPQLAIIHNKFADLWIRFIFIGRDKWQLLIWLFKKIVN